MLRYIVVGFISTFIDFGILYILTDHFGFFYLYSATISFIFAAAVNYYLNRVWTFQSNGKHLRQVPLFLLVAIIGLLLNNFILWLGVELVGLYYLLAKVISTGIVMVSNYLGNKYLTFRK